MSAKNNSVLTVSRLFLFVILGSVLIVLGEEASRSLDQETGEDAFANQRELREYDQESWHVIHNTPESASGWIPRDLSDTRSEIVYTKRRRLRKRKKRPPIVNFLDENPEDNLKPSKKFEPHKQDTVAQPEGPVTSTKVGFGQEEEFTNSKRRKRPNLREPWEEMQEESVRPYVRRKVTPAYQTFEETDITGSSAKLSIFKATIQVGSEENSSSEKDSNQNQRTEQSHVTTKKQEQSDGEAMDNSKTSKPTTIKTPNLKSILKQSGGLSLSEILQQKNLTLAQLLMGNQEAIKVLTEPSEDPSPSSTPSWNKNFSENLISSTQNSTSFSENLDVSKYKRLPPSVALKKENINRKYEQYGDSHESLSDQEMLEAQRKRLALLQGHIRKNSQNGKFSEVTRFEVITEPTTEKRIFVPSHPKLYTSIDYKPELSKLAETRTEAYIRMSETTTTQKFASEATPTITSSTQRSQHTTEYTQPIRATKTSFTKSKLGLPITSAYLNKIVSKGVLPTTKASLIFEEENYPVTFKPLKIDIKDVLGFLNSENQPKEKNEDEPFRMSIDLETIPEKSTVKLSTEPPILKMSNLSTSTHTITTTTPTISQDIPKLKPISAKDEIQEILKDPEERESLAKVLEARNMTIEELIDQRERGSSQLHLADIFHNKTMEPEPVEEVFEGRVSSEVFTSFPVFNRQPKVLLEPEKTTQKFEETTSPSHNIVVTAFPSFKIEISKDIDKNDQTFPWKQLYPDLFNLQDTNKESPVIVSEVEEVADNRIEPIPNRAVPADVLTEEDIQRLDDLDQRLLSAVSSEQLNIVDEKIHKIIKIPSGVQSAIVASLIIVGLSLIVFVTILVVFRWTQKQKSNMSYCDSLKPPLFDVKPRNIKTFVTKTLDKSKITYYKSNLQSMSDNAWERESNRKASF